MRFICLLILFSLFYTSNVQAQASGLSGKRLSVNYLPEGGILADQRIFYINPLQFEIGYVVSPKLALNLGLSSLKSGKYQVESDPITVTTNYYLLDFGIKKFKNLAPLRAYWKMSISGGYNTFEYQYNQNKYFVPEKDISGFTMAYKFAFGSQRPINNTLFAGYEFFISLGNTASNNHKLLFFKLGMALNFGAVVL